MDTEFSNREVYDTDYDERILFHYEDKLLAPDLCIDPWELNDLLTDSCCAIPVTCTCGDESCGDIRAASESWVIGNKIRLYIPEGSRMYFFEITDRIALRKELCFMLQQAIRNVQRYKRWRKKNIGECDEEDEYILPEGTTLSSWQKLCKEISKSLD